MVRQFLLESGFGLRESGFTLESGVGLSESVLGFTVSAGTGAGAGVAAGAVVVVSCLIVSGIVRVPAPGLFREGGPERGDEDWPLYPCPGQRTMASVTCPLSSVTISAVPQERSHPFSK
jgi:hypothetical protein